MKRELENQKIQIYYNIQKGKKESKECYEGVVESKMKRVEIIKKSIHTSQCSDTIF